MKTLPIVLVTVMTSALSPASNASSSEGTRMQEVHYADLDITREPGAERLYKRIRSAAREICGTPGIEQIINASTIRRCAEEATARAVAQVNSPALTRYYEEKNGSAYRDMTDIVAAKKMRPEISSM